MKKSAFTLIELLVVISIIAILASIAVPVFGKALEKGKATSCKANLRQLGIGVQAYLNDNEDQMFPKTGSGGTGGAWPVTLHDKYVANWKVFRSPFDPRPDRDKPPDVPVSYGLNENLFITANFNGNASRYAFPSQLILMAPLMAHEKVLKFAGTSDQSVELPMASGAGKFGTHAGRTLINVLYADTHVDTAKYAEFADSSGEEGQRRWMPEGSTATAPPP